MSPSIKNQLPAVINRALHDSVFRSQLIAQPKEVLKKMDVSIPEAQKVTVLENTEKRNFFVLPTMTQAEVESLKNSQETVRSQRTIRSRILIQAWQDPTYKAKLMATPKQILLAEGIKIPPSIDVTVVENSEKQLYLVLPCLH